ncbi:hypothetical protein SGRIM128S_00518 [Streptomyces griseomycini]
MASHRRPKQPSRARVTVLTTAAAAAVALSSQAANAAPSEKPSKDEVKAKVDKLYQQAEQATEKYNGAKEKQEKLQKEISTIQDDVARGQQELNELRDGLGSMASAQYRSGGIDPSVQLFLSSDPDDYLDKASTLDQLSTQQVDALKEIQEKQRELAQQRSEASEKLKDLASTRTELGKKKKEVQGKLAAAQKLLNSLTAEEKAQLAEEQNRAPHRGRDPLRERPGRSGGAAAAFAGPSYRVEGHDRSPVTTARTLRLSRDADGRWTVDSDRPARKSGQQLWDQGPVRAVRGERALVLGVGQSEAELRDYAGLADRAVPAVSDAWGPDWTRRVVVLVPESLEGMAGLLGSPASSYRGIAAVTTGETGTGERAPADRIIVNPDAFGLLGAPGRQVVLTHETTHVATRAHTSAATPLWLSEGFADWVGYRGGGRAPAEIAPELAHAVRRGEVPAALPDDADFGFSGDADRLARAYESGWTACRLIADRWGEERLGRSTGPWARTGSGRGRSRTRWPGCWTPPRRSSPRGGGTTYGTGSADPAPAPPPLGERSARLFQLRDGLPQPRALRLARGPGDPQHPSPEQVVGLLRAHGIAVPVEEARRCLEELEPAPQHRGLFPAVGQVAQERQHGVEAHLVGDLHLLRPAQPLQQARAAGVGEGEDAARGGARARSRVLLEQARRDEPGDRAGTGPRR